MAVTPMRKVLIVGHRSRQSEVVEALQKLGAVELGPAPDGEGAAAPGDGEDDVATRLRRVDEVLRLLRPHFPPLALMEKVYPRRPRHAEAELQRSFDAFDLEGFLSSCDAAGRDLGELRLRLVRIEDERRELAPWASLDASASQLRSSSRVEITAGRLPLASRKPFLKGLEGTGAHLEKVHEDDRHIYGLLVCHRECGPNVCALVAEQGFEAIRLPAGDATPAERLAALAVEKGDALERIARTSEVYRELASKKDDLQAFRDLLSGRLGRLRAERLMGRTRETFSLQGWAPAAGLPEIRRSLEGRFDLLSIEDHDAEPHERAPVVLDNSPLVRPFGLVVDLYGLPRYGTIDPSAVMAVFFALFFGLCLTDAGYGIFVALVTGGALALAPRPLLPERRRFLQLFFLCGLATVAAGAAAGGWFGVSVPWRLFDPLENLMFFFLLSLGVGTLHLFAGLGLRIARLVRSGDLFGAAVDQGLWILLISALLGTAAGAAGRTSPGLYGFFTVLAAASALGIVLFQGRSAERESGRTRLRHLVWAGALLCATLWFSGLARPWTILAALLCLALDPLVLGGSVGKVLARIGLGLYALYGITGYLSDILSYSRLVALGLGTGIVALVVNKMAAVALGAPGVGVAAAGAVLVVGHLFNVVINLLGAFVHSCRLQYVEFFTKFYESGGRPFAPFRLETKYITIEENS